MEVAHRIVDLGIEIRAGVHTGECELMDGKISGLTVSIGARVDGLQRVDVLGFSIGGYVAQAFTVRFPDLVRRLVLVGTAPRGGEQEGTHPDVPRVAGNRVPTREDFLFLFFEPSETSKVAGKAFW